MVETLGGFYFTAGKEGGDRESGKGSCCNTHTEWKET